MLVLNLRPFFRGIVAKSKSLCFGSAGFSSRSVQARSLKKPLEHVSQSAVASALRVEISRRPGRSVIAAAWHPTRKPDAGCVFARRSPATLLHVFTQVTLCNWRALFRASFGAVSL